MWDEIADLFTDLASAGGKIVVDAWVSICMAVWGAGLWLMRVILALGDWFLTPNLAPERGSAVVSVYGMTLWLALSVAVVLLVVQLITTVARRDAASLGAAVTGSVKFLLVCTLWYTYGAALVTAVAGLNRALRIQLLGTAEITDWDAGRLDFGEAAVSGSTATVLMLMGLLLWLGALAHLVVMLGRAVSLVVLSATAPLAAAGLMYKPFEGWFWKAFRWFHAAALAPLLMTLMLGMGVQLASGVSLGLEDSAQEAAALALPSVVMIMVAALSPVALFRMLAFVDPGTSSGASFRAGLAAPRRVSDATDTAATRLATTSTASGVSQQRAAAMPASTVGSGAASTTAAPRTASAAGSSTARAAGGTAASAGAGGVAGPAGAVAAGVMVAAKTLVDGFQKTSAFATGIVADANSTMGVGDPSYPYDPTNDLRVTPSQRSRAPRPRSGAAPIPVREAEDRNGGESL